MRIRAIAFLLALVASAAAAGERPAPAAELGLRYWVSTGETRNSHNAQPFDPAFGNPTSVLTYENLDAHALEVYGRRDFAQNAFLKGTVGLGRITTGAFRDEDFFAGQQKFSDTTSSVPEGRISYLTLDVGVLGEGRGFGLFLGYGQWIESVDAYGATDHLGGIGGDIRRDTKVITNKVIWRALRVGLAADLPMGERTRLGADLAFVPYAKARNEDSHYLRADPSDLGATPNIVIDANGRGFQLELELRHEIVPRTELGVGWRYWYFKATDGERKLPNADFPDLPLVELYSKRYGVTLSLTRRW